MPARDLRDAVRALVRRPVLTLAAVGSLALGIGATTALSSLVGAVLVAPLPGSAAASRPATPASAWR
jgi:hypothetical protein